MRAGDLVEVMPGVWDAGMPNDRRDGLVVEVFGPDYRNPDQIIVMFSNGNFLKFHKSQLNLIVKI